MTERTYIPLMTSAQYRLFIILTSVEVPEEQASRYVQALRENWGDDDMVDMKYFDIIADHDRWATEMGLPTINPDLC